LAYAIGWFLFLFSCFFYLFQNFTFQQVPNWQRHHYIVDVHTFFFGKVYYNSTFGAT
jgi:hypothetical protein